MMCVRGFSYLYEKFPEAVTDSMTPSQSIKIKSDLYQEYKDLAKGKKQLELIPESLTRLLVQATTTS